MKLLRVPLVAALILASAAFAFAQKNNQCALKAAPEFRGFFLGMSMVEVRSKLEDTTLFDMHMSGSPSKSTTIRISAEELNEKVAEGIDEINLAFIDGKLAMFRVTYNSGMTWDSAEDFLAKVSETLGLPKPTADKSTGSQGNEKYRIECKSFAVTLAYSFGASPNFTINDMAAQRIADQRLEDEKDTRRINISPNQTVPMPRRP